MYVLLSRYASAYSKHCSRAYGIVCMTSVTLTRTLAFVLSMASKDTKISERTKRVTAL